MVEHVETMGKGHAADTGGIATVYTGDLVGKVLESQSESRAFAPNWATV